MEEPENPNDDGIAFNPYIPVRAPRARSLRQALARSIPQELSRFFIGERDSAES